MEHVFLYCSKGITVVVPLRRIRTHGGGGGGGRAAAAAAAAAAAVAAAVS